MKKMVPTPLLSLLLFLGWLLLAMEISLAHVLLGLALAIGIPKLIAAFLDHLAPVQNKSAALRLIFLVTWDIVIANITVARLVLGPNSRLSPMFVEVPLEITNPKSIALLASIITMTPGTVSADLSQDNRLLLVHALDCSDGPGLIADIKKRYEKPLLEIFGC